MSLKSVVFLILATTTYWFAFDPQPVSAQTTLSTPVITCVDTTRHIISIQVCAGTTGAPFGFSIQWMTEEEFISNGGWYASDDPLLCKASFSGQPKNSVKYNLGPNECVTVQIGNLEDAETGVSTNCLEELFCGTGYVFRAFAHAGVKKPISYKRSAFTADLYCSTEACDDCTLSQGYWKNHPDHLQLLVDLNGGTLNLGNTNYTGPQLTAILQTPASPTPGAGANALLILGHQLIAAKLNVLNGTTPTAPVAATIITSDGLIGNLVIPPVGGDFVAPGGPGNTLGPAMTNAATILRNWIETFHCE